MLNKILSSDMIMKYIEGNYAYHLFEAVKRMEKFEPSVRMKAKMINEKMFKNIERMVDVSEEEFKAMSLDEKKRYTDFAKNVTNMLDELVTSQENAYGVKTFKKKSDSEKLGNSPTLMDRVLAS
jgi:chloramphenicol O-acetyltransferase